MAVQAAGLAVEEGVIPSSASAQPRATKRSSWQQVVVVVPLLMDW